jgi:hypothetical protein
MVMITTARRSRCRHQPMLTAAEKLLLQDLYPRLPRGARQRNSDERTMGWVRHLHISQVRELSTRVLPPREESFKVAKRTIPPPWHPHGGFKGAGRRVS